MKKLLTLSIALVGLFLSNAAFADISGPMGGCVGTTSTLTDSLGLSGVWASSTPSVATVGSSSGIVTAHSVGTSVISFTSSAGTSTLIFTVSPTPGAITGGSSPICVGSTMTLSNSVSGGTWYSSSSYVATIGASTGVVTGAHAGTSTIMYSTGPSCSVSMAATVVSTVTSDSVTGPSTVCVGSTTTLSSTAGGGTWSSSSTGIATVSASGVVTGVAAGTAIITHTTMGACGTSTVTRSVTVTSTTSPGSITGTTTVNTGFTTTLSNSVTGGTWSSSDATIATISSTGVVTGVAAGTAVITYTVTGCSGPAYTTTVVTVTVPNCISGSVLFPGVSYYGGVKVWLIHYDPTTLMLTAVDSDYVYSSGASADYSFCGLSTDSFRVKAAVEDSLLVGLTTGYQPTYHTASAYWGTATVIYHTSGTHDMGKDINMGYGTITSGPGFIAGNVTTGANKGTADGAPAVGMLVFCVNNTTGAILQKTYTDASGYYEFSNLPVGEPIKIYPELINYATTPYPAITLTTGSTSMTAASFIQHTLSHKITPIVSAHAGTVSSVNNGISLFPNPTSGMLNVQWGTANSGNGTVTVTDVAGRQVMATNIDMSAASGHAQLNLETLNAGLYMVNIKANGVNYNAKVQVK